MKSTLSATERLRAPILLCALFASTLPAADWPQSQGPDGTGISSETGLARKWPASGPRALWTRAVSSGFAGAAIRAGRVYALDRPDNRQEALLCLDLQTGAEYWRMAFEAPGRFPFPGARTVPAVDPEFVYIQSPNGLLQCIRLETRKPVWSQNIVRTFQDSHLPWELVRSVPKWGITQHPTLAGDKAIVAPYAVNAGVVALDRRTGATLWRSSDIGLNVFCHTTPLVTTLCGVTQVVTVANSHGKANPPALLTGLSIETGRILWQMETWRRYNVPIPQPVRIATNRLFVSGGYTIGCFVIELRPSASPDAPWKVSYVFRDNRAVTSFVQNPVFYGGHLYAQSCDTLHQQEQNGLTCVTPDGQTRWKTGPKQIFYGGGFLIADRMIYAVDATTGDLVLADATPDRYNELARARVLDTAGEYLWAPLALSDGKLVLRDLTHLKCLDVRSP